MAGKALGIPSMKREDIVHLDPARWGDMVASSRAPAGPFQVDYGMVYHNRQQEWVVFTSNKNLLGDKWRNKMSKV